MKKQRDPFSPAGALLAPLAVVPAAAVHLVLWFGDPAKAEGALYAALVLLPLSYSIALLFGLPLLYGLRRLEMLTLPIALLGALATGLAVGATVAVALFPPHDWYGRLFYISLGAFCGVGVALAYWPFVWWRGRG